MQLILEVWREVCRHLEIHESVERLLPTLAAQIPLEALAIRRVDRQRSCLETVACGVAGGGARSPSGKPRSIKRSWASSSRGLQTAE